MKKNIYVALEVLSDNRIEIKAGSTSGSARARMSTHPSQFYCGQHNYGTTLNKDSVVYEKSFSNYWEREQKVINTIRYIANYLSEKGFCVKLHHGHQYDQRSNPASYIKNIDKKLVRTLLKKIADKHESRFNPIQGYRLRRLNEMQKEIEKSKEEAKKYKIIRNSFRNSISQASKELV